MLVSHLHEFIFLKTVKTAGTSVEIYLERYCEDDDRSPSETTAQRVSAAGVIGYRGQDPRGSLFYNHAPASLIREAFGPDIWRRYLKITCIRNPFDKTVSAFWFSNPAVHRTASLPSIRQAFRAYVLQGNVPVDRHVYTIDGPPCCDIYIRYEQLLEDLEIVCRRLDIPFEPVRLGRYKTRYRPRSIPTAAYYDDETIARVHAMFAPELEWFGYPETPDDDAPAIQLKA